MFSFIELVDSVSRDGPDTPIYVMQYCKKPNKSAQITISRFLSYINIIFRRFAIQKPQERLEKLS